MMAADSKPDRLRLIIEPDEDQDGPKDTDADAERARQRRPEDMIDLERLESPIVDYEDSGYEFEDEEAPPRRRLVPALMAAVALFSFGAAGWYAYESQFGGGLEEAIPLIQADAGPIKTRPAAPGGLEIPHQDQLVLNELAPDPDKPQVERLLPPPEVPKPPVASAEVTPSVEAPAADAAAVDAPVVAAPIVKAPQAPAAGELAAADTRSKPDSAAATGGATQSGLAPAAGPEPQAAPAPAPPAAKAEPAPPPAAPAAAPSQAAPAQSAALTSGYMVQLASLKDKNLVGGEWLRLQRAFPTLLAGKKLVLQAADLGSRGTFHRVRAGYFANADSAAAACQAFKAKNQGCIVVRP